MHYFFDAFLNLLNRCSKNPHS